MNNNHNLGRCLLQCFAVGAALPVVLVGGINLFVKAFQGSSGLMLVDPILALRLPGTNREITFTGTAALVAGVVLCGCAGTAVGMPLALWRHGTEQPHGADG